MFDLRKKGPTRPFTHAPDCPILRDGPQRRDPVVGDGARPLAGRVPMREGTLS